MTENDTKSLELCPACKVYFFIQSLIASSIACEKNDGDHTTSRPSILSQLSRLHDAAPIFGFKAHLERAIASPEFEDKQIFCEVNFFQLTKVTFNQYLFSNVLFHNNVSKKIFRIQLNKKTVLISHHARSPYVIFAFVSSLWQKLHTCNCSTVSRYTEKPVIYLFDHTMPRKSQNSDTQKGASDKPPKPLKTLKWT